MKLYGIKTCDTCRKALRSLEGATFIDIRQTPLSPNDLSRFYAEFGDNLVNKRSTTWRGLDDAARGSDPVALLTAHPTLMKRPVIDTGDALHLGWGKDVQSALL